MANAPKKRVTKSAGKKTAPLSTKKAATSSVNKIAVAFQRIEKEVDIQKKKVADAKQKLSAAKNRVTENATKASQALLKKRIQEVTTNVRKLNNLVSKNTLVKAELRAEKILSQLADAEEKARNRILITEKKLEQKTASDLDKAMARYKKSWLKKRTTDIAKKVRTVERNTLAKVKTIEKRLHKKASAVIRSAEQKINGQSQAPSKTISLRGPGRPPAVTTTAAKSSKIRATAKQPVAKAAGKANTARKTPATKKSAVARPKRSSPSATNKKSATRKTPTAGKSAVSEANPAANSKLKTPIE